ncbi:hypothetical protein LCGC14_0862460 [marine sediment metagenome]|uniref:Uncharacterized protein n=1 Tax=marine sediment metagenome TaxID=412755 RepID=A0A0F9PSG9_9ZZZZ
MRVLDIEKLFKTEKTLLEVLDKCEVDFNKIDYWSEWRKQNLTDNPEEITKALNELSGCYGDLLTILAIAETELVNREARQYNTLKIEWVNEGKSFTTQINSSIKKQASVSVADYRRIYNIIKAYVGTADKHIITLQSILNRWTKGYNHPQGS